MWYLVSLENPDVKFILLCGKEYIVGRKDCDIQVSSDASVSRKHAQLTVSHSEANLAHPENLPILTIKDLSKFGTWKNKDRIEGQILVQDGDELVFGSQKSVYTAVYEPFIVTVSCLDKASKQKVRQLVCKVGGHVVAEWGKDCSLLVMNSISVTIKVVCAMLAQKSIVSPEYLVQYVSFLQNETTNSPNPNDFIPQVSETQVDPSEVSFAINPDRKNIFQGKTFIFLQQKQFQKMTLAVELGGGTPVLMDEKPGRGEDAILTEEGSLVMNCPLDNAAPPKWKEWHRHVMKTLTRHKKHMIQDAELGYAVMYCSTDRHCNPDTEFASQMPTKHLPSQSLSQAPDFSCLESSAAVDKIQVKQEILTPKKPEKSRDEVKRTSHVAQKPLKQSPDSSKHSGRDISVDKGNKKSTLNLKNEIPSPATSTRSRSPGPSKTNSRSPSPTPKSQNKQEEKSSNLPSPLPNRQHRSKSPSPVPNRRHKSKSPSPEPSRKLRSKSPSPVPNRRHKSKSPSPVPNRRHKSKSPSPVPNQRHRSKSPSPAPSRRSKRHAVSRSPSPEIPNSAKDSKNIKVKGVGTSNETGDSTETPRTVTIKTERNSKRKNVIAEDSDDDFGFSSKRAKKTIAEDSDDDFGSIRKKRDIPTKTSKSQFSESDEDNFGRPRVKAGKASRHKSHDISDDEECVPISDKKRKHSDDDDDDFGPRRGKKRTNVSPRKVVTQIAKSPEIAKNEDENMSGTENSNIKQQRPAKKFDLRTMKTEAAQAVSSNGAESSTSHNRQEKKQRVQKMEATGHAEEGEQNGNYPPAGFLTTRGGHDKVAPPERDAEEKELPSNLVVTKFVDLVRHPAREVSHRNDDEGIPEGFTKWKNRIVKNFKQFKKAQNIRLPNIIGGSDLVPHIGTQRKEIEDWFREAQQMESQQAEADREASELFDWQPQAGTKRSRR